MTSNRKEKADPGLGWAAGLGVSFIVVSLLVLAFVPVYLEQVRNNLAERARILNEIQPVDRADGEFVPTLRNLRRLYSQMAQRVQQYVNTENPFYQDSYRDLLEEEMRLTAQTTEWEPYLPAGWDVLRTRVINWKVHHGSLMGALGVPAPATPEEARALLAEDDRQYQAVRQAVLDVEEQVLIEAARVRGEIAFRERLRVVLTTLSALMGVAGVLAVVPLTRHFRGIATREAERRLENLEARREIQSVLEATGDGVVGVDLLGRCMFVNTAGARMLGYEKRHMKGRSVHDLILHTRADGSERPAEDSPLHTATDTRKAASSLDEVLWRADGSSFPAQLFAVPMLDGRTVTGVVLTFSDLTDVRRTQAALEEAVTARDEVLAVVSHDLRNPVGTIGAAAELLTDVPLSEAQKREHLHVIRRSAERMGRLIQDLLDVARIESGSFAIHLETIELNGLVREAVEEMEAQAGSDGVSLSVSVPQEPVAVEADRYRLLQVLSNLIGNAVKFTPEDGSVRVELEARGGDARILVMDTGPGIPPESLDHLFDRFWKGHRAERKGAGLGLAIVQGIVEAHGGEVSVESTLGQGSRFSVRLPLSPSRRPTPAAATPDPS